MPRATTGAAALALAFLATALATALPAPVLPAFVPEVALGFTLAPLVPVPAATAITFGPGGADGEDLYATTLTGLVMRYPLAWTPAGPVPAGQPSIFASNFGSPLGLVWHEGALFVADSHDGLESGQTDGRVTRIDGATRAVVIDGLPNGRHNTNNLRSGPDGRLYVTNGNPNDNGVEGGSPDVFPYSGAILSVDAAEVTASPAILRWRDANGVRIPESQIAAHPSNADFAAKVDVLAWGFRNVYDVAFSPAGIAYTGMNGADDPDSQDALYKIAPGTDYGFPFCYNEGPDAGTAGSIVVVPNPVFNDASRCAGVAPATALLGWHTCATGLDFPRASGAWAFPAAWRSSVYVAECGPFQPDRVLAETLNSPTLHNTGHKIVRVALDANGEATEVRDFITGLALPTDVQFGPDGAMYVGDLEMVYRVAPAVPALAAAPPETPTLTAVAGPGAWVSTYATPALAAEPGGALTFVNADLMRHDLVARGAYGPDSQPWCRNFLPGRCPLFWTPLLALGQESPVLGLEKLAPLGVYEFTCTIHPGMTGRLAALPAAEA